MTKAEKPEDAAAELFRVLAHETRLRLLGLLSTAEHAVGELEAASGVGQPGLSQQLAILRKARLVTTRRAAKQVYYRLDPAALAPVSGLLAQLAGTVPAVSAAPTRTGSSARFARII
jgi:DNA-binding transcriptional ArsR family regulator